MEFGIAAKEIPKKNLLAKSPEQQFSKRRGIEGVLTKRNNSLM
jgi:hypothetical protein